MRGGNGRDVEGEDWAQRGVPTRVLDEHQVYVKSDGAFDGGARLLQALWRERQGLPIGEAMPGVPRGSCLGEEAAAGGHNFLSEAAREAAREVTATGAPDGPKHGDGELWRDLLSNHALALNLFADMALDLERATVVLQRVWEGRVARVTAIRFGASPAASNEATVGRDPFEVYVEHTTPENVRGRIVLAVNYHQSLRARSSAALPASTTTRAMGCFRSGSPKPPFLAATAQLLRGHVRVGTMMRDEPNVRTGLYAILYPHWDALCGEAIDGYAKLLTEDCHSFEPLTLEQLVKHARDDVGTPWADAVEDRYLRWDAVSELCASAVVPQHDSSPAKAKSRAP